AHGRREPRRRGVPRARPAGGRPGRQPPRGVRRRYPLLPGRAARTGGGRDRHRCTRPEVPPAGARDRRAPLARHDHAASPERAPGRRVHLIRAPAAAGFAPGDTYTGPVDRRIFGPENEYGVTCTFRGQRRLSPDEVARYLFRRVVHWGRSSNVFLENGARLYLDVGSHPEYATPECDAIRELVAHDKAGERILEGLLAAAELRLHEEGISGQVYLFKNN